MSNIDRHPRCHMRTSLGNCDPLGGFCTSVNEPICEALHKVSRPQGEWVSNHDGSWNCSECGLRVLIYAKGNFCPNCGADMRGEKDETD